ncbi:hypothetical protein [Jiangella mangrovi]|uniref:Uncharacterized protein n=1 Tax=Jiangella mangrovi TaxID=1524084 RepID=A0A7W9GVB6_9ACTN|nr:hypothetical protein [Jiangella mangrovi]MBB5790758.1 hypothetical protein [Jiangella mangrovi]
MRRVLRAETFRGVAAPAALVIGAATLAMVFSEVGTWAGRWSALAAYLRVVMIVLIPLTLAAGAWQGGRDHRRRTAELLTSTSRPLWQRTTAAWGSVTAGVVAGFLLATAVCALLVGRVATYSSGGWWWLVVVGVIALGAAAAVGLAAGMLLPWRLTAPVVGLAGYFGLGILTYVDDGRLWLSPAVNAVMDGSYLPFGDHLLQAAWFALLAVAALTLVGSRRRWPAAGAAALAVAAGVVIATGPTDDRWQPDPVARELVCVDGDPEICTTRETEFLLGDFAVAARETLTRLDGIGNLPGRVEAVISYDDLDDGRVHTSVEQYISWAGTLRRSGAYGGALETDLVRNVLPSGFCADADGAELVGELHDVALLWAGVDPRADQQTVATGTGGMVVESTVDGPHDRPLDATLHDRLTAWPRAEQVAWMECYITAGRDCDLTALAVLRAELAKGAAR